MVWTAALALFAAQAGTTVFQKEAWFERQPKRRQLVLTSAYDEALKRSKVIVAVSDSGTRWMVRPMDIAPIWEKEDRHPFIWVFADHSSDKTVSRRETRYRFAFNCEAVTYKVLTEVHYGPKGDVLWDRPVSPYSQYEAVVPETMAEALYKDVCDKF